MKILFLAPYSIPINNPEAICNAKLIKVLCDANYELYVISKNNNHAYTPDEESSCFIEKVKYIKTFELKNVVNLKTIWDHFRVFFKTGFVYKGAHWAFYAIKEGERLIKKEHIDLIMSRSPSSEIAALYLSMKYNLPWIANWNDPYPDKRYPEPYGDGVKGKIGFLHERLLKKISSQAICHTFPSERLANYMKSYMLLKRTVIIPHVCIDNLYRSREKSVNSHLRIIHSGNISFPRSPEKLFAALQRFKCNHPEVQFEFSFIGKQDETFMNVVIRYDLKENITILTPSSYVSNLKLMENYDLALLVEAEMFEGIYLPTKVGDYMQAALPIWSLSPKVGVMNDLFNRKLIDYFSDNSNVDDIYNSFEQICNYYYINNRILPQRSIIKEYDQESILKSYDTLFKLSLAR